MSRNGAEDAQWHKREIQGRLQLVCQTRKDGESGLSWEAKKLLGSKRLTKKEDNNGRKRWSRGPGSSGGVVEVRGAEKEKKQSQDSSSCIQRFTPSLQNEPFPESFG